MTHLVGNSSPCAVRLQEARLKKASLELGGKSPAIVFPDADMDVAIRGTASAIFFNMGQCCTAGSRLFVHKRVFDKLMEGIASEAGKISMGPGLNPDSQMGPLVSEEQFTRVTGFLEAGRKEGARVVTGGEPRIGCHVDTPVGDILAIMIARRQP